MHVSKLSVVLGASVLALSLTAAQAAGVTITGGTVPTVFPGYGPGADGKNNIVNQGPAGTGVHDLTAAPGGSQFIGTNAVDGNAMVTTSYSNYNVDYWLLGGESGYINTFHAPDVPDTADPNAVITPLHIGTSLNETNSVVPFSITVSVGPGLANGGVNPEAGSGVANFVFAYLEQVAPLSWNLVSFATDWFVIGWNDNGGPDDNHDDIMLVGHVTPVPVPAALPLFAGGVGLLGWLARRKRRQQLAAI
jgi:hypothetical protein